MKLMMHASQLSRHSQCTPQLGTSLLFSLLFIADIVLLLIFPAGERFIHCFVAVYLGAYR